MILVHGSGLKSFGKRLHLSPRLTLQGSNSETTAHEIYHIGSGASMALRSRISPYTISLAEVVSNTAKRGFPSDSGIPTNSIYYVQQR